MAIQTVITGVTGDTQLNGNVVSPKWLIDLLSMVLCLHQHNIGYTADGFFTGLMTQPTVSKHWRRVVSHPDRPRSNQAHLTVLQ